jgi:hypothetical protein
MRGGGRLDLYRPGKNQKTYCSVNSHNFSWLTRMKTFSIRKLIYRKFYTCDKLALLVSAKLALPNSACKMGFRAFKFGRRNCDNLFCRFCDRYGLYVYVMHVCNFFVTCVSRVRQYGWSHMYCQN